MPKRSAEGKVKPEKEEKVQDDEEKDMFGRPVVSAGVWSSIGDDLLVWTHKQVKNSERVAAFDMDGTLITTKSGKVFPVNEQDWKMLDDRVAKTLKKEEEGGRKIVVFTNQKGIQVGKVDKKAFKKKIEAIAAKIGCPLQFYISTGSGAFRKPSVGMWKAFVENGNDGIEVDLSASIYVGDAAGRHKTKSRPRKDHSSADRFFAANIGVEFATPEQFFMGKKNTEPWGPPSFDVVEFLSKERPLLEPHDAPLLSESTELIVMCGFPGSGKSSFAAMLEKEHGYAVVSRDVLGTWQKCVDAARKALKAGKSVVVDNTNPDVESRLRYSMLAKELKVQCRCFEMIPGFAHSQHNVRFRSLNGSKPGPEVSTMVLRMHQSKYKKPEMKEGYSQIVQVNFVPRFEKEEDKKMYGMHLNEN